MTLTIETQATLIAVAVLLLFILYNYTVKKLSQKIGRDVKEDIDQCVKALKLIRDLNAPLQKTLKAISEAADDGEITAEEIEELKKLVPELEDAAPTIAEAAQILTERVSPYIDLISKSGIFSAIWKKIKSAV